MTNKTKFNIISYIAICCMFLPIILNQIYLRKNGVHFKYEMFALLIAVMLSMTVVGIAGKLLGVNPFVNEHQLKNTQVNFLLRFLRIIALCLVHYKAEHISLYARVDTIDKNTAVQQIWLLWGIAIVILLATAIIEEKYNKKRYNSFKQN